MKHRSAAIVCALGMFSVAVVGCSSNSSSSQSASPSPSASITISKEAFCTAAKEVQQKLTTLGQDLASGNAGKVNPAVQELTTYYNLLLAALPANQNAAITQALEDAKSNLKKGASNPNNQESMTKLVAAIKKECPNV